MEQYTYEIPIWKWNNTSTKMPIINEHGETVFEIRKIQHKFLAWIVHHLSRTGLPYCYKIANENGKPLYTLDCAFPGMGYKITDHLSSEKVSIASYRVQLLERGYRFKLNHHEFQFEQDATGTGFLTCDNKQVAYVFMPMKKDTSLFEIPKSDTIIIRATTLESASLAALLFHTFFYYDA